jgi:CRP-like cAMP-binding protein
VNVQFNPNQIIYKEGDPANTFFLLRQGRVGLEINVPHRGPITIETICAGELLGWSWMVPPYKWQFTARALELTKAIAIDGQFLRNKCAEDSELGYEIYACLSDVIVDRLHATLMQLFDVYSTKT